MSSAITETKPETKSGEKMIPRTPRFYWSRNEETDEVTLTFEMPGISKKDVDVKINENRLTVVGRNNRRYFKRELVFRNAIDPKSVSAKMENGVLALTIKPEQPEVHTIKVK